MNSSEQQFVQQWQAWVQQLGGQVSQILQEADGGCRQLVAQHPNEPIVMTNALQAIKMKLQDLNLQVQNAWSQQIQHTPMMSNAREVQDQCQAANENLDQWIEESFGRLSSNWRVEQMKAMWAHVQEVMQQPVACTQCGGAVNPRLRHVADTVTCPHCGAVNQTSPSQEVYMFYTTGPDVWAEAATLEKRFAIDRQRRQVNAQMRAQSAAISFSAPEEPAQSAMQWEDAERDYWTSWFAAKAQIMPTSAEDQKQMVDARMRHILEQLKRNAGWRQARGYANEAAVVPPLDLNSLLSPIEGVSIEQYASIAAKQAQNLPMPDFLRMLAQNGMDQAKYDRVSQQWIARMSQDHEGKIATIYAKAFSGAGAGQFGAMGQAGSAEMGGQPAAAGFNPASVSFEMYCEIMGAQSAWSAQGKDVNAMLKQVFNMSALDYSNVASYWSPKMMADMSMAMRMSDLMMRAQQKYMAM